MSAATKSAGASGVIQFWGTRPIGMFTHVAAQELGGYENLLTSNTNCRRLAAGTVIGAFAVGDTTTRSFSGHIHFVGDST
jgi:hypothetical protein